MGRYLELIGKGYERNEINEERPSRAEGLKQAHQALQEAIDAVAVRWNALPADLRPELAEEEDRRLETGINTAFRAHDPAAALAAVRAWREAWERVLPPSPPC